MEDLSNCITNNSPGSCTLGSHTEGTTYIHLPVVIQTLRTGNSRPVTWDVGSGEKESFTYGDEDEGYTVASTLKSASASVTTLFTAEDKIWDFWKRHNRISSNPVYLVHRYTSGNNFETFRGPAYSAFKYAPVLMRQPTSAWKPQSTPFIKEVTVKYDIVWED